MYRRIPNEQRLSLEVANREKELIRKEKLKPGDKLPNEMQLAKLFGVSRPTVREAVKSLVSQNIIEIQRGKGTFVSETPGIASDPLGLEFVVGEDLHLSLIEVRLLIEPGVARLAAERGTPADIDRIGKYLQEFGQTAGQRRSLYGHAEAPEEKLPQNPRQAEKAKQELILRSIG